jgi:dipeptidyl aminopeptidase/acylaminoacyl peptidase
LNPQSFITPELVQIESFDGLLISRWLYLPDARKFPSKHPMIMDFPGGPESQSRVQFMGHRTTI